MPRKHPLYPGGAEGLSVWIPGSVKDALRTEADRQRQSMSQLTTVILEDWLRRRGALPNPVEAEATA